MAKSPKMREVESEQEAYARLGITAPEAPAGEAVTTGTEQPASTQQPAETVTTEEPAIQLVEEPETLTQAKPKEVPEEEQVRRTWQAEADKAKAQAAQLQEQIRLLQAQNQQLVGVVSPFLQKYGQQPAVAGQQADPDQEPQADYIEEGYFDPKKFADYQRRRDVWLSRRLKSEIKTDWQKEREQETLQQQIQAVAKDFPEYVNPLTGQVDIDRVHRDLQAYTSQKTITDLLREAKGISPAVNGVNNPLQQALSAIEKNADRPQAAAASSETEKEKKPVPKQLEKLRKTFGDIELPPDFEGFTE